jgi:hypothetical protein
VTRLLVHVEGQTEETFSNSTLAEHLYGFGYTSVRARLLGNARTRTRRGGIRDWQIVRNEIANHLKHDPGAKATTMVDYYALPPTWPGRSAPPNSSFINKSQFIHNCLLQDFEQFTGIHGRFLPFVLMYEFEALLFSDCSKFGDSIGFSEKITELQAVRDQFNCSEEINDSPHTAPSKRVGSIIPGYDKVLFGNVAASDIGIVGIRADCPTFHAWMSDLENWV